MEKIAIILYNKWEMFTNLLPSRLIKCGYCKLKCKSRSASKNGVELPLLPPKEVLFKLHVANDGGPLPVALLLPIRYGTGIS